MGPETVVTLLAVAVLVGALAAYLIIIAVTLNKVSFTVGTVLIGVRAIEHQTQPLASMLGPVVNDVAAIEEAMAGLAGPRGQRGRRGRSSKAY